MIKDFQKKYGLVADGVVGKKTAQKIGEVFNIKHLAEFLGQLAHESGDFTLKRESGKYSAARLKLIFGYYKNNPNEALQDAYNEQTIFNKVYANRLGNVQPNDGFYFRGNASIQLTGRSNHKAFENWLVTKGLCEKNDIMLNPDLVWKDFYLECAIWFFDTNKLWTIKDVKTLTKRINGGYTGLEERIQKTEYYRKLLK